MPLILQPARTIGSNLGLRSIVNEARTQPATDIEHRQATLQAQIAFVLCTKLSPKPWNHRIRIVDRFGPDETRQKRKPAGESLIRRDLKRMIRRVRNVLPLKNGTERRKRSQAIADPLVSAEGSLRSRHAEEC